MSTNTPEMDTDAAETVPEQVMVDVRKLSAGDFARLGLAKLAYVKAVTVNGAPGFAIHAADGTPMAVAGNRDLAIAAIVQHEMVAALVH